MDKKLKKKLLLERKLRNQIIEQHAELHQRETARRAEQEAERLDSLHAQETPADDQVWSARVQDIRNKLTGKKRSARDRWNRYSGTSGSGGMGR